MCCKLCECLDLLHDLCLGLHGFHVAFMFFSFQAMFELVTSEASYYKSLEILETHFLRNSFLVRTLSNSDMHFLFSNIEEVMKVSER